MLHTNIYLEFEISTKLILIRNNIWYNTFTILIILSY